MTSENHSEFNVLSRVAHGEISAEEAEKELDILHLDEGQNEPPLSTSVPENKPSVENGMVRRFSRWSRWWTIPYGVSAVIMGLGAIWIYQGWSARPFGFGFWLAWIPFLAGIAGMALSWQARVSRWMYLKIRGKSGRRPAAFQMTFPLPTRLIKWVSRNFGGFFPNEIRGIDLDEFLDALENTVNDETPIYIWVDDDKEGQQVEIWIGGS